MPNRDPRDLHGADEDPSFDPVGDETEAGTANDSQGRVDGLLPAVNGDGPASARNLRAWLLSGRVAGCRTPRDLQSTWGALRRSPGALETARRQGYLQFTCKTHGMIHCRECNCPSCGAPGGCSCNSRRVRDAHAAPPLPRPVDGVRRSAIELEMMVDSERALQAALEAYVWGHHDGSVRPQYAPGWYAGVEFKVNHYGHDAGRATMASIVDRIHGVGGVGAPSCCGVHVHIERSTDDNSNDLGRRWMAIQEEMYSLFPTRQGNTYVQPLRGAEYVSHGGHYCVLNRTTKNTYELRLHPGTTSWVVAAAWSAWVHGFVSGGSSAVGEAYVDARRAALAVSSGSNAHPWVWRRRIERWHRANGADHGRTLAKIASGAFRRYENEASLRAYLAERQTRANGGV